MAEEPRPAATVVLLRDAAEGLEVLLLERATRSGRRPAPWVFPGGKLEAGDGGEDPHRVEETGRRAAVRELREETGLELVTSELVTISRWITPEVTPKRFDTWFYAAAVEGREAVRVDGGEIADHRWFSPRAALHAHDAGEIRLAPPTFVTVTWLVEDRRATEAVSRLGAAETLTFRPRICPGGEGACILYPGDAGYEEGDPERPGPRHRLWALPSGYRYERAGF